MSSAKAEFMARPKPSSQMQPEPMKTRRRHLFCLLLLANIIVLNVLYGTCTAEKDTPIWKIVTTDNLICKLWRKYPLISKSPQKGMVNGILFNDRNSAALINKELVHEGDAISGVKIIQICPRKIKFEKNGKIWTQGVQEKPNAVWKHIDNS